MKITIVAPYCSLPSEPHFNRFWYLAELLAKKHDVLLITSNFRHFDKSFRWPEEAEAASRGRLKVMMLNESGYTKNVSPARIQSHRVFVKHFQKWLEQCRPHEQDVVYSAYPFIATNILLGKNKTRLGYKLIIDVQDIWPESFSAVLPFLKKIPHKLLPFAARADKAYRFADGLVAVSQTYLNRAKAANPTAPGEVVYIGADYETLENAPVKIFGRNGITRFFYLGTLSFSYDMQTVCQGIRRLADEGEKVELHIMGGGPDLQTLKQYNHKSIYFYGYIHYSEMMSVAKGCDIAVNPIHVHSSASITNKLSDYMALQKPILNSQTNDEVAEILQLVPHANYRSGDVESFTAAAKHLLQDQNTPADSEEIIRRFKREVSYQKIVRLIEIFGYE